MPRNYGYNQNPFDAQNDAYGGPAGNGTSGANSYPSQANAAQYQQGSKDAYGSFGNMAQQWSAVLGNYMAPNRKVKVVIPRAPGDMQAGSMSAGAPIAGGPSAPPVTGPGGTEAPPQYTGGLPAMQVRPPDQTAGDQSGLPMKEYAMSGGLTSTPLFREDRPIPERPGEGEGGPPPAGGGPPVGGGQPPPTGGQQPPPAGGKRPGDVQGGERPVTYDPNKPHDPVTNPYPDYDAFAAWSRESGLSKEYGYWQWLRNRGGINPETGQYNLDTKTPEGAAAWYSVQGPEFYKVKSHDVDAYRANPRVNGKEVDFPTWWRAGNRGTPQPQQAKPPTGPFPDGSQQYNRQTGYYEVMVDGKPVKVKWSHEKQAWMPIESFGPNVYGNSNYGWPPPGVSSQTPPPGGGGTPDPNAPPPGGAPPPGSTELSAPLPGGGGTTGAAPGTPEQPQLHDYTDLARSTARGVFDQYSDLFSSQRNDYTREAMATAANKGLLRSGGFGENLNRGLADLTSQQSAYLGDKMFESTENALNRALEQYQAELSAAVQQEGIRTNADLERKAQELQKYGIDKGDLLERYKAELGLQGIKYSADAQVNAAALHAAASSAAANAQAAAMKYNADLDYKLGSERLGYEDIFNKRAYDLGVFGVNRDIYLGDQNDRYKWALLKWYMSPEYRAGTPPPLPDPNLVF